MISEWVVDLLIDFAAIFGVILGLYCLSRFYYKRSVMATLAEWYLRCTEKKYPDEKVIEDLPKLPLKNDVPLFAPKRLQKKMPIEKTLVGGMQVFVFNGGDRSLATLYLHGAGYVRPPRKQHWNFAFRLAQKTGGKVFFAVYPKAPNHTCDEAYELLLSAYKEIRAKHETVVLAGDSSGGGLALGFYQKLVREGQEKPNDLWLLSPWVDLSMENPQIEKYAKTDPLVCVSNERIWAKSWARERSLTDPAASPLFGEMAGIERAAIFIGTREALYPDALLLAEKMKNSCVLVDVFVGEGLNHVYPVYPIPEAKTALQQMIKRIEKL